MNHLKKHLVAATSLIVLSSCADKEVEIELSEVPANVITVVQNTLPGIALDEAEKEVKDDGSVVYELEGKLINGKEYEIKINNSGTILKIELDD